MASGDIWLAIIVLIPVVASYLLLANAAPLFLSLCLGYVLYSFDSHNALSLAHSLSVHNTSLHLNASDITINLVLLLGPAVLTLISQRHTIAASRRLVNLVPAIFSGLFCVLITVPVLPVTLQSSIIKTTYWTDIVHQQVTIVGIGSGIALIFYWYTNMRSTQSKKSKSKQ